MTDLKVEKKIKEVTADSHPDKEYQITHKVMTVVFVYIFQRHHSQYLGSALMKIGELIVVINAPFHDLIS